MPTGDVYELILYSQFDGKPALNVFHYLQNSGSDPSADELAAAFVLNVIPDITPVQSDAVIYSQVRVVNLDDDGDFTELPMTGITGEVSGDALPSFAAWSIKLTPILRYQKPGGKRFVGVPESLQSGELPTPTAQGYLNTLCTTLAAPLGAGDPSWLPVVLSRYVDSQPRDVPLPVQIKSATSSYIGSQNTRKFKRR